MAGGRPNTVGLVFFSLDVDIEADAKIEQLELLHGGNGLAVFIKLLCLIYKESYFIQWKERIKKKLAAKCKISTSTVDEILQTCLDENLFNNDLYKRFGILTSGSIQDRYLRAVGRRSQIIIVRNFALFSPSVITSKISALGERAFYSNYENIDSIFVEGSLHPQWKTMYTSLDLVIATLVKAIPFFPLPDAVKEVLPPVEPVTNGRQYGDPSGKPKNFDWEREKQLLRDDLEYKEKAVRELPVGTWRLTVFTPDFQTYEQALEDLFNWLDKTDQHTTAARMKVHLYNWYPKRKKAKEIEAKSQQRSISALHVGPQDYSKMKKF